MKRHHLQWIAIVLIILAVLILLVFAAVVIGKKYSNYQQQMLLIKQMPSHADAVKLSLGHIGFAREMNDLYPHVSHFITYYRSNDQAWNSKSYIANRYELSAQADCVWDPSINSMVITSEVRFSLSVVDWIKPRSDGGFSLHYLGGETFGIDTWNSIVEADGELGVVGYPLDHDVLIEHFESYRDYALKLEGQ